MGSVFFGLALSQWMREWRRRRRPQPKKDLARRWHHIEELWKAKNLQGFLTEADTITYELLMEKVGTKDRILTRSELLAAARSRLPETVIAAAKEVFTSHQQAAYSPKRELPKEPQKIWDALTILRKAA